MALARTKLQKTLIATVSNAVEDIIMNSDSFKLVYSDGLSCVVRTLEQRGIDYLDINKILMESVMDTIIGAIKSY